MFNNNLSNKLKCQPTPTRIRMLLLPGRRRRQLRPGRPLHERGRLTGRRIRLVVEGSTGSAKVVKDRRVGVVAAAQAALEAGSGVVGGAVAWGVA